VNFKLLGECLLLSVLFKLKEVAQIIGYFFPRKSFKIILTKMVWATVRAMFTKKNHLVTLPLTETKARLSILSGVLGALLLDKLKINCGSKGNGIKKGKKQRKRTCRANQVYPDSFEQQEFAPRGEICP
jgi:hypothetical protein